MAVRAISGAIQLDVDERGHLLKSTAELVTKILHLNNLNQDQLVSMLFTATADISSEFPSQAVKALGLGDVPTVCFVEMNVVSAIPRIIRVIVNVETDLPRSEIQHVYLRGAEQLSEEVSQ